MSLHQRDAYQQSIRPLDPIPTYAQFAYAHYAHITSMELAMTNPVRPDGGEVGVDRALKRIEFLILAVLQTGPLHGYGIVQEISRRTDGGVKVRPGSLYRVLDRLMNRGLLELAGVDPQEEGRRTDYRITDAGEAAVRAEAEILSGLAGPVLDAGQGETG